VGAQVIHVSQRGYGAALTAGIAQVRGRCVLMANAHLSYDLPELPRFAKRLREGRTLVQGGRVPSGRGRICKGAMTWLHRDLGEPVLSALARR